jgi:cytochrome P450
LTDQLLDGAFPHDDPFPLYARLRDQAPVAWNETLGFWAVSRMAEVMAVSTDNVTFCSSRGILTMEIGTTYDSPPTMMHTDPPDHTVYRKLVQPPFGRRLVGGMDESIRSRASRLLGSLPLGEPVDIVEHFSVPLPVEVIADLLGMPDTDVPKIAAWSEASIPGSSITDPDEAMALMAEMSTELMELAAARRAEPGEDLISLVTLAEFEGRSLRDDEIMMFLIQLLVAGNETTRNMLSGSLVAFSERPEQWRRLRGDPTVIPLAIEEMLRWTTPVISFMRTATVDTQLDGVDIAAGDHVLMLYASANRDPATFGSDADEFRIDRDPNHHVAFGFGAHFCLGATLARLEARVALEELLALDVDLEPAGDVVRSSSTVIAGVHRAPLVLQPC